MNNALMFSWTPEDMTVIATEPLIPGVGFILCSPPVVLMLWGCRMLVVKL